MKHVFRVLLTAVLLLAVVSQTAFSQRRRDKKKLRNSQYNYEATVVGTGVDGVKLLKVWGYDKKPDRATVKAKKNAVAVCVYKGAAGVDVLPALVTDDIATKHEAFFNKFFETGGEYLSYVALSNDASGTDQIRIKRGYYKVGIVAAVMYDKLRKRLENEGIIKKLGDVIGTARKPTIMVVPSDNWCIQNGYTMTFDDQGSQKVLPDYRKALQGDADLLLVIGKINSMMADRGFPLKNLESVMKRIEQQSAENSVTMSKQGSSIMESPLDILKRTAKADIIIQLTWKVNRKGPKKSITFNLQGLDSYTDKQIAGAQGTGLPSFSAEVPLLLEEAVLAHLDKFNQQLQLYFSDMAKNGREISINIQIWDSADFDLEEEMGDDGNELTDIIENWLEDNTVNGTFSTADATENMMIIEGVRIPLFRDKEGKRKMDARRFVRKLSKFLRRNYEITSKTMMRGLGQANLILGEK